MAEVRRFQVPGQQWNTYYQSADFRSGVVGGRVRSPGRPGRATMVQSNQVPHGTLMKIAEPWFKRNQNDPATKEDVQAALQQPALQPLQQSGMSGGMRQPDVATWGGRPRGLDPSELSGFGGAPQAPQQAAPWGPTDAQAGLPTSRRQVFGQMVANFASRFGGQQS